MTDELREALDNIELQEALKWAKSRRVFTDEEGHLEILNAAARRWADFPTDADIEAAAEGSWNDWWEGKREPWTLAQQRRPVEELDLYRDAARAALLAVKDRP